MIPMVMANDQIINVRHVFQFVNVGAFKRFVDEKKQGKPCKIPDLLVFVFPPV